MPKGKTPKARSIDLDKTRKHLNKNLDLTVKNSKSDLDSIIESIQSISYWSNVLQDTNSSGLADEIFMDAYMSIHYASLGLYKYADTAMRSALENSLNWIYFSSHPVEFSWWKSGDEWFLSSGGHPWGRGYEYFKLLIDDPKANTIFDKDKTSVSVAGMYSELSKASHSNSLKLQTSTGELSPVYDPSKFGDFAKRIRQVMSLINSSMILVFQIEFKKMNQLDRKGVVATLLPEHHSTLKSMGLL